MAERKALALIGGRISEVPATDTIRGAGASGISQLTSDPVTPTLEQTWVLATQVATVGSPMGLLLSLTNAQNRFTYQLRFRTLEGTTIGTPLT